MKVLKKILYSFLIFIIAIVLPFVVFTLITSRTGMINNIRSFVIMTGSMRPTIPVGAVVYTQQAMQYHKGDIIAFNRDNIIVTHRIKSIIKKNNTISYQTKGDANNVADIQLVSQNAVIGKEYVALPHIGNFILLLRTIPGFAIFIGLPTLFVIILEILNIKKEMEKSIEKKIKARLNIEKT